MFYIYGKANCPSCDEAKNLLSSHNLDFKYYQMGKDYDFGVFYSLAPKSHKSFPMITIKGDKEIYLGGLNDLKNHLA